MCGAAVGGAGVSKSDSATVGDGDVSCCCRCGIDSVEVSRIAFDSIKDEISCIVEGDARGGFNVDSRPLVRAHKCGASDRASGLIIDGDAPCHSGGGEVAIDRKTTANACAIHIVSDVIDGEGEVSIDCPVIGGGKDVSQIQASDKFWCAHSSSCAIGDTAATAIHGGGIKDFIQISPSQIQFTAILGEGHIPCVHAAISVNSHSRRQAGQGDGTSQSDSRGIDEGERSDLVTGNSSGGVVIRQIDIQDCRAIEDKSATKIEGGFVGIKIQPQGAIGVKIECLQSRNGDISGATGAVPDGDCSAATHGQAVVAASPIAVSFGEGEDCAAVDIESVITCRSPEADVGAGATVGIDDESSLIARAVCQLGIGCVHDTAAIEIERGDSTRGIREQQQFRPASTEANNSTVGDGGIGALSGKVDVYGGAVINAGCSDSCGGEQDASAVAHRHGSGVGMIDLDSFVSTAAVGGAGGDKSDALTVGDDGVTASCGCRFHIDCAQIVISCDKVDAAIIIDDRRSRRFHPQAKL